MAAKKTKKTVAFTVTLKVPVAAKVSDVASFVRGRLPEFSPRVTPIKEA